MAIATKHMWLDNFGFLPSDVLKCFAASNRSVAVDFSVVFSDVCATTADYDDDDTTVVVDKDNCNRECWINTICEGISDDW